MRTKDVLIRIPLLGTMLIYGYRAKICFKHSIVFFVKLAIWLYKSKETTNFTYDLEKLNISYLASLIADITDTGITDCVNYINEIKEDAKLRDHIEELTRQSDRAFITDTEARFGRRIGWYVFVRVLKPKIVVETGVDKGLGACVLTSALMKNKDEGYDGYYYGTDINRKSGYLLQGDYKEFGEILYGDSIESLRKLDKTIDVFINDSSHSSEYEGKEYEEVETKLTSNAVILGDNSHVTDKLFNFALKTNRHFVFFHEKPLNHWYPGAGIGIAFKRNKQS